MIYSEEGLKKYQILKIKQKRTTWLVASLCLVAIIAVIVIIFTFKLPYLAILGFCLSLFTFGYVYSRRTLVHKKLNDFCDFYYDVLYGERSVSDVVFSGEMGKSENGGREFNYVVVFDVKTQSQEKLYYDIDYSIDMRAGVKYRVVKTENMLIDYCESGGKKNGI